LSAVTDLVEKGVSAYTRGLVAEAEQCWRQALELEPGNQRARAFMSLVVKKESARAVEMSPKVTPALRATLDETRQTAPTPASPHPEPIGDFDRSPWEEGPALAPTIVVESEGGLDLAAIADQPRPAARQEIATPAGDRERRDVEVWMEGARELFALGDFSGSLEMLEKILKADPEHYEARAYLDQNESTLVGMYESKLGPPSGIPRLAIKPEEVLWLNLDHRAGFVLAQIDGKVTVEDLFALSGLPRLDTAKILAGLLAEGVITT
jgi:tetratricopeptide (TPR) repeat protein